MAKTKLNPALESIQGAIGDLVFKKQGDQNVVARKPDLAGRPPTPSQEAHRERFRRAAAYARSVDADPALKETYEVLARARKLPWTALCIQDYMRPPEILLVDLSGYTGQIGQTIRIVATDAVRVETVRVTIATADDRLVEEGHATREAGDVWLYTTTASAPAGQTLKVTAAAADRPGNVTTETRQITP